MKWRDLCFLPEQEWNAIQVLKYVTLRNLLGETLYMDRLDLVPLPEERWFFLRDEYGEYHFVASGWDSRGVLGEEEFVCPHRDFHKMVYFLSGVHEGLQDKRWSRLRQMIYQLRGEYPAYCHHCKRRTAQLAQLPTVCRPFLHSPLENMENATPYVRRHCEYMHSLLKQTQQEGVLCAIVKDTFDLIKDHYRESLLQNNTAGIISLFRRDLISRLYERKLSFLSFQDIDFGDWLVCLMYMEESQCTAEDDTDFRQMVYKLWILLNLYFTERPARSQPVRVFLYPAEEMELDQGDMESMLSTHPLLRGSLLSP